MDHWFQQQRTKPFGVFSCPCAISLQQFGTCSVIIMPCALQFFLGVHGGCTFGGTKKSKKVAFGKPEEQPERRPDPPAIFHLLWPSEMQLACFAFSVSLAFKKFIQIVIGQSMLKASESMRLIALLLISYNHCVCRPLCLPSSGARPLPWTFSASVPPRCL